MFSVLRGSDIEGRSGTTLEGEAGVNDPAGIALMVGMIELATHGDASFLVVVREFAVEMGVGAAMGLAGAAVAVPLLRRVHLPERALYPVFALLLAASLYGATSLARGSGFLAVFVTGLVLGEGRFPAAREIQGFHTSLATLAEVVVFGALGLTVRIGELDARIWLEGLVLALALAIFIRPVVVAVVLARARLSRGERTFIAWTGLKGAVPILLAAFAILGGASGAEHVYGVVFVVVLVSVVGQGTCVPFVARRLRIPMSPVAHRA
jgi:cell volume regulation protein A